MSSLITTTATLTLTRVGGWPSQRVTITGHAAQVVAEAWRAFMKVADYAGDQAGSGGYRWNNRGCGRSARGRAYDRALARWRKVTGKWAGDPTGYAYPV